MAFESLADKLQNVFKNLRGKGRLTEADVKTALKEVKMALLEADVSFKVVKQFISSVQERAVGQDVLTSLTQMCIRDRFLSGPQQRGLLISHCGAFPGIRPGKGIQGAS